jgi:hypothetical protein
MISIERDSTVLITDSEVVMSRRPEETDSSRPSIAQPTELWSDVIDTLLGWSQSSDEIVPACLQSAIDFAWDQREARAAPPTSVIATEDGDITFEWRSPKLTIIVTILDSGRAEYVKLHDSQVVEEGLLRRNPLTRKLELEGD